jgi:hypothetical protein
MPLHLLHSKITRTAVAGNSYSTMPFFGFNEPIHFFGVSILLLNESLWYKYSMNRMFSAAISPSTPLWPVRVASTAFTPVPVIDWYETMILLVIFFSAELSPFES